MMRLSLLLVAVAASISAVVGTELFSTTAVSSSPTTAEALARAKLWVDAELQYCQSAYGQRDYDTSCSTYCNRQSHPAWNPYRSDCSGLASWAWGLPPPGRTTLDFAPFDDDITHVIEPTNLAAGDAVNNDDHIMLFVRWEKHPTEAVFYEEPGCSSSPPHARETITTVSINDNHIYLSSNGMTFNAIRRNVIPQPPSKKAKSSQRAQVTRGKPAPKKAGKKVTLKKKATKSSKKKSTKKSSTKKSSKKKSSKKSTGSDCLSVAGINLIASFEGFEPNFYYDSVGVKTIGYGTACFAYHPGCGSLHPPLSEATAKKIMTTEIAANYAPCVKSKISRKLSPDQFTALVSFVYNLGCGNLGSDIVEKVNAGDMSGAASIMHEYDHAGSEVLAGLARRREAEGEMLIKGGGVCFA